MNCIEAGRLLDPYLDGELDAEQSHEMAAHLSSCPACSQRLAEREALSRLIRAVPYASAPARLRNEIVRAASQRQTRSRLLGLAAAATLAAAAGLLLPVLRTMRAESVVQAAVSAHVQSLGAGPLVQVRSTDRHTVKPWFQGKLDFAPPVEDTAAAGFPLLGGRVDRLGGDPVAALVYQRRLHTINVFVKPASARDDGLSAQNVRGFEIRHWTHAGMAFWAVSDVNGTELDEFVRTLQNASP